MGAAWISKDPMQEIVELSDRKASVIAPKEYGIKIRRK